ncbi:hypothetical protein HYC85_000518 [Camellia sinensis]|uniref:Uncharacterized protein n=1 Tax=Camellia sinensis TaxID=4442 RepID=A0A7J7I2Z9_CAMSI|nr:hypothetical protein HYC85_000518 [Camellia sinensis]
MISGQKETKIERRNRAAAVVLGDFGRSPRMQYHALSLAHRAALAHGMGPRGSALLCWCTSYHGLLESCLADLKKKKLLTEKINLFFSVVLTLAGNLSYWPSRYLTIGYGERVVIWRPIF